MDSTQPADNAEQMTIPGSDAQPIDHITTVNKPLDNTGAMPMYSGDENISIKSVWKALKDVEKEEIEEKTRAEKSEEETPEEQPSQQPAEEKTESEDKSEEDEEKAEEEGEEKTKEIKQRDISFLVDDKEVPISNTAIVEITVDGKKKKLPLQEVLNRASGDIAVHDRLNAVQAMRVKEERELQKKHQEVAQLKGSLEERTNVWKNVETLVKKGDANNLFGYLAMLSGGDPREVVKKLYTDSANIAKKLEEIGPQGQELWFERLQTAIEKAKLEEERRKISLSKQQEQDALTAKQLETYTKEKLQAIGANEEDFLGMLDTLQQNGIAFKATSSQDRVDEVLDYIHESRVISAAKDLDPALLQNQKLLQKVFDVTLSLGMRSEETIKKVLREVTGKEDKESEKRIAENLSRKVQKSGTKSKQAKEAGAKEDDVPFTLNEFHRRMRRR